MSRYYPTRRCLFLALLAGTSALVALLAPVAAPLGWLAIALVVVLAARDLHAARSLPLPTLERALPERARLGEPARIRYTLRVEGGPGLRCSALLDELPADLGGDLQLGPRVLEPGRDERIVHELTPRQRGLRPLGYSYLYVTAPLGLFERRIAYAHGQTLCVYPANSFPERSGLGARSLVYELGLRPRRPRGAGTEFESLREYTPDDEPRKIDWRASARSRELVVREFHTERNHTILVAVDCGRLMAAQSDGASKLDHALSAAVSLVRACSRGGDRIGFVAFDRELRAYVPPQRPARALGPILEATLPLQPRACEPSYRTLASVLQQRQKKRALIVVLTDFVEGASTPGLQAYLTLLARRHCVLLVGVRDRLLRSIEHAAPDIDGLDLYRRLVLQDLDVARKTAIAQITRLGVQALDLDAAEITAPLLDRYLQIRDAGLL